jgi:beta-glucosidase
MIPSALQKLQTNQQKKLKALGKPIYCNLVKVKQSLLTLNPKISFICYQQNAWLLEAGNYKVAIGSSSSILKNSSIFISKYQNSRKTNPTFTRFEVYWFKALIQ